MRALSNVLQSLSVLHERRNDTGEREEATGGRRELQPRYHSRPPQRGRGTGRAVLAQGGAQTPTANALHILSGAVLC
eukprot:COSAG05_NODE_1645_length_4351_cov_17.986595_5_plen_77_part_00